MSSTGGLKPGDYVKTPEGPAKIVELRQQGEWRFGPRRNYPWAIVEYPGGRRHAWVMDKIKPLEGGDAA